MLDGGLLHWKTQGYPIEQGPSDEVGKGNFEAELNGDLVRSFEQMREILAANSSQVSITLNLTFTMYSKRVCRSIL